MTTRRVPEYPLWRIFEETKLKRNNNRGGWLEGALHEEATVTIDIAPRMITCEREKNYPSVFFYKVLPWSFITVICIQKCIIDFTEYFFYYRYFYNTLSGFLSWSNRYLTFTKKITSFFHFETLFLFNL